MATRTINPYNFFPLSDEAPQRCAFNRGKYTGKITFSLLTRTPLFIPNTSNNDAFDMEIKDHCSYDFFSYSDLSLKKNVRNEYFKPVIPGSEIRGMIRSYYEILTNSCLSKYNDEILSKRTAEVFKAGLIKRNSDETYSLYPAEDCIFRTVAVDNLKAFSFGDTPKFSIKSYKQNDLSEGQKIYFNFTDRGRRVKPICDNISTTPFPGSVSGYVIKGEEGPETGDIVKEKHNCHVFMLNDPNVSPVKAELSDQEVKGLSTVLNIYHENGENEYNSYNTAWKAFKSGSDEEYFPVYYSKAVSDYIMLSPASITREVYKNRLKDILNDHIPCDDMSSLCPACALFGTIGNGSSFGSRLRFSDMDLSDRFNDMFKTAPEQLFEGIKTLPPLGQPNIKNLEFYVKRPDDAWFWTYDYYIDPKGNVKPYKPQINGRKFYWHNPDMELKEVDPDNLNTTIRPVKKDIAFTGTVYFEHLTEIELNELIYTLNAGDTDDIKDKKHCLKLGHGRPLGLGSVALSVDKVEVREFNIDEGYQIAPYKESEPEIDPDIKTNFAKMTDFNLLKGKVVCYPRVGDEETELYQWFVKNHTGYDRIKQRKISMPNKRQQMVYNEYLEAMTPELKSTREFAGYDSNKQKQDRRDRGDRKQYSPRGNNPKIEATITSVSYDGSISFKLADDTSSFIKQRFLPDDCTFNVGDRILITLLFNDRKTGKPIYQFIKKQ